MHTKQHEGLFTQFKKFNAKSYRKENTSMDSFSLRLALSNRFMWNASNYLIHPNQDQYFPLNLSPTLSPTIPTLNLLCVTMKHIWKRGGDLLTQKQISAVVNSQHCKSIQQLEIVFHSHSSLSTAKHITFGTLKSYLILFNTTFWQQLCHQDSKYVCQKRQSFARTVTDSLKIKIIKL